MREPSGYELSVAAAPRLPAVLWPAIGRQVNRSTMSHPQLAIVAQDRRVVMSANILDDPSWDGLGTAIGEAALVSSWSLAFAGAGNSVLGALVVYLPAWRYPDPAALLALGDAGQLAAAAVQHGARRSSPREPDRTDTLTGLPNRIVLLERLRTAEERLSNSRSLFAVIQLAIDGLAQLNETLGAAAGDEVLRLAAQRLVGMAGPSATVAHIWGVEFVVLVEDLESTEQADEVAAAPRDGVPRTVRCRGAGGVGRGDARTGDLFAGHAAGCGRWSAGCRSGRAGPGSAGRFEQRRGART